MLNSVYLYIGLTESLACPVVGAVMRRGSGAASSVTVKDCSEVRWLQLSPGVHDTYWIDVMSGNVVMFSIDLETVTGHMSEVMVVVFSFLGKNFSFFIDGVLLLVQQSCVRP